MAVGLFGIHSIRYIDSKTIYIYSWNIIDIQNKKVRTISSNNQLETRINLPDIVGKGYRSFWNNKNRYRVLKGGRASKKSRTAGLSYIYNMMKHPLANTVVVRNTFNTHKDSTYAVLKWAARRLNVYHLWKFTENPLEARYIETGQKILFRGFDDVFKLTSITVDVGVLCWAWVEEGYEIEDEEEFQTFDESIRGEMPDGLWKQVTITYNPWVNKHWTKTRFWDISDDEAIARDIFRLTTTYKCNEWIDDADKALIEGLERTNPERYKVVGLGEYGIPGGTYFDEFRTDIHVVEPFVIPSHWQRFVGVDYGFDMFAVLFCAIDDRGNAFIYKEIHQSDLIISMAAQTYKEYVSPDEKIKTVWLPPDLWNRRQESGKSAADIFRENGVKGWMASSDRVDGWLNVKEWLKPIETTDEHTGDKIMTARLKIFKTCQNLIRCLPQVQSDDRNPMDVSTTPHDITHIVDALRYLLIMRMKPSQTEDQSKREKKPDRYTQKIKSMIAYGN